MKVTASCDHCGQAGNVHPVKLEDISVMHREADGFALAWDDISGNELDPGLVLRAREDEMEQFKKHQLYEKV